MLAGFLIVRQLEHRRAPGGWSTVMLLCDTRHFVIMVVAAVVVGCPSESPTPEQHKPTPQTRATPPSNGDVGEIDAVADDSQPVDGAEGAPPPKLTIDATRLEQTVRDLSADEMLGRGTRNDGSRLASLYIAKRFEELGLQPLPGTEDHRLPLTLYQQGFDPAKTHLAVDGLRYVAGAEFTPFDFSGEGRVEGQVVFVGYGITAPKHDWDDYEGLDVRGKIVLVLRHYPDEGNEKSPFVRSHHAFFKTKAENAKRHGAIGMLLVTDPLHHMGADDLRLDAVVARKKARARAKVRKRRDRLPLLAAHVSRKVARNILDTDLEALQRAVDTGADRPPLSPKPIALEVGREPEPTVLGSWNVAACVRGSDEKLRDEWIVVGGHYDHIGSYEGEGDTIFNGADDNASGTSAVLAIAEAFAKREEQPNRSVAFVLFGAEELGLFGSHIFVQDKVIDPRKIKWMINLDMVGRNPDKPVQVLGDGFAAHVRSLITSVNERQKLGVALRFKGTQYSENSDHHPFHLAKVPWTFFFSGFHDDYHDLGDHADQVAYARLARLTELVFHSTVQAASGKKTPKPVYTIAWLGVSVGHDGRVERVEEQSPAQAVGIAEGDQIARVGGRRDKVALRLTRIEEGSSALVEWKGADGSKKQKLSRPRPGFLGIYQGAPSDARRKALELGEDQGVVVMGLTTEGPARDSGLEKGDIIVEIAGRPVSLANLRTVLEQIGAGTKVPITYVRGDERDSLDLELGTRPDA